MVMKYIYTHPIISRTKMQKNRLFAETLADDVEKEACVEVGEHLTIAVYIEGWEPKGLLVHVGYDLSVWWEEGDGTIPVIGSGGLVIRISSGEARPDIGLGECIDETAVGEGFDHIDPTTIDPCDEGKSGDIFGKFYKIVGIFFNHNITGECFSDKYVIEEIWAIIDDCDGLSRESLCCLVDDPPPGGNWQIPKLLNPDEEADPGLGDREIIIIERPDMIIDEVPKRSIDPERFFDDFYVALDEIFVKIVDIRVYEGDVEDVRPPEDIRSGDDGIVELFVAEDSREVASTHIEEKYTFVSIGTVSPSEQESPVEEIHVFPDHLPEFRFVISKEFRLLDDTDTIRRVFDILEEESVLWGREDDNLSLTSVRSEPLYEETNEWLRDNRIPDTIRAIEIDGCKFLVVYRFWAFHPDDSHSQPHPDMTRDFKQEQVNVEEKIFEHCEIMNDL